MPVSSLATARLPSWAQEAQEIFFRVEGTPTALCARLLLPPLLLSIWPAGPEALPPRVSHVARCRTTSPEPYSLTPSGLLQRAVAARL